MKIATIDVFQVDLPYAGETYHLSGGRTYSSFDATLVRVTSDDGVEGWGESTPFGPTYVAAHAGGVLSGVAEIAPAVIGADPTKFDRLNDKMDAALLGHAHAKSPIDVACWDIFGKTTGRPVCDLLGGRIDGPVPLISSIGSAGDPEGMRKCVADHRAKGFTGHSLKVGTASNAGGPDLDAECIKVALADRQPGEWFQVDCNGGLTPEHVIRMLNLLPEGTDIVLEAPCATWRETLSVRRATNVPIMLDELAQTDADIVTLLQNNAADGVGLKVTKQGGLTAMKRQRDMCRAAGLVTSIQDTVGSEVAFSAILHMAQSTPRQMLRCALDTRAMVARSTAEFDAPITVGGAEAPNLPGLGISVDTAALGPPVARYS